MASVDQSRNIEADCNIVLSEQDPFATNEPNPSVSKSGRDWALVDIPFYKVPQSTKVVLDAILLRLSSASSYSPSLRSMKV